MWRVGAFLSLMGASDKAPGWSDLAEVLFSTLLGYSDKDIDEWMARTRNRQSGWGGETIYFVLGKSRLPDLERVGYRCLSTPENFIGMLAI